VLVLDYTAPLESFAIVR